MAANETLTLTLSRYEAVTMASALSDSWRRWSGLEIAVIKGERDDLSLDGCRAVRAELMDQYDRIQAWLRDS
jgi:hypothetical protein